MQIHRQYKQLGRTLKNATKKNKYHWEFQKPINPQYHRQRIWDNLKECSRQNNTSELTTSFAGSCANEHAVFGDENDVLRTSRVAALENAGRSSGCATWAHSVTAFSNTSFRHDCKSPRALGTIVFNNGLFANETAAQHARNDRLMFAFPHISLLQFWLCRSDSHTSHKPTTH